MDLVNYIKQARQAGRDDVKIRDELAGIGWKIVDIQDAFNYREPVAIEPNSQQPTVLVKPKKPRIVYPAPTRRSALLVVAVGILLGYFAVGYFYTVFYNLPMWPFNAVSTYY